MDPSQNGISVECPSSESELFALRTALSKGWKRQDWTSWSSVEMYPPIICSVEVLLASSMSDQLGPESWYISFSKLYFSMDS